MEKKKSEVHLTPESMLGGKTVQQFSCKKQDGDREPGGPSDRQTRCPLEQ